MKKLTIAEASSEIGISKEAIHNRIRRGSLECVIEDGIKFVMVSEDNKVTNKRVITKTIKNNEDKYHKLLEEQNKKLQEKIDKLELETRELREQKEKMLIAEKAKIEHIYIQKDEQLKSILNAINANAILNAPPKEVHDIEIVELKDEKKDRLVSLKKYLKKQNIAKKKRLKITTKFKKLSKKDSRIIYKNNKCFIQPNLYDYSDILKLKNTN